MYLNVSGCIRRIPTYPSYSNVSNVFLRIWCISDVSRCIPTCPDVSDVILRNPTYPTYRDVSRCIPTCPDVSDVIRRIQRIATDPDVFDVSKCIQMYPCIRFEGPQKLEWLFCIHSRMAQSIEYFQLGMINVRMFPGCKSWNSTLWGLYHTKMIDLMLMSNCRNR